VNSRLFVAPCCAVLVIIAISASGSARAGPVTPDFSASNFTPGAPIDNTYYPLVPGTLFRSSGVVHDPDTGETSTEVDETFVTFQTEIVAGVTARRVSDRVFTDGVLTEETTDLFAQDKAGNVWYLGERTAEFERDDNGKIINTDTSGSWLAGVHGAKPGFILPVDHTVGFNYREEFAPDDEAVDQATIVANDLTIDTKVGHFTHVLKTRNFSDIEPGVLEQKFYAPGVGQILEEDVNPNDGTVINSFPLESVTKTNAIPLPASFWSGVAALGIAGFAMWRLSGRRHPAAGSGRRSP
jgi:hypothetical protein